MNLGKLFSFDGRIGRGEYWGITIAGIIVAIVTAALIGTESSGLVLLGWVGLLVLLVVSLATQVKRWHDRGKSGAWILISFIPLIGSIWALIELGFLAGTFGDNQYGSPAGGSAFGQ